jgi:flagellar biosynthetic protein FliR
MPWENADWNTAWFLSHVGVWALALARVLGVCLTAPALAVPELDWRFRLGLAALLGTVVLPAVEPLIASPLTWPSLAWAGLLELLAGGVIGWSAALIVAGARLGGELAGAQAGLSAVTLFDPETGGELGPLGRLYGWIALVVFLALEGPLELVRALVESYDVVPAAGFSLAPVTAEAAFTQVGRALELALKTAAPAAVALALAGIVVCWLGRAAASLSFAALALPVRSLLGIVLVLLSLATLVASFSGAWSAFSY